MCLPLTNLCLDTIAANFQRYNYVFTTTEDDNMKLKLEFLQRKYSFELVGRLCMKDELPENCIDFLINKYLKIIDTSWFRKCSWDKVTSKIAEIGSNVEEIILKKNCFGEHEEETPWQEIVCHLPNLKIFNFPIGCHDLILTNVAKFCPNIEEIYVEKSKITFEAVKCLCKNENGKSFCMKLKKLGIAGTHLKDDDVKYLLKNLPSLEIISYRNLPLVLHSLDKNDLSSLDKVKPYNITKLDVFDFAESPFSVDTLKVCLSVCPHLKSLTCSLVDKDELNFFSNLFDLEKLCIENFSHSEINIDNLLKSKGEKLTSLEVFNCTVSLSVLVGSCSRIKKLILDEANLLFDEDFKPAFSSLFSCVFKNVNDSTSARAIGLLLQSSAKLESISFTCCDLRSSEIKAHIMKCCELYPIKEISFRWSNIEKEYVKDLLLNCHSLKSLDVDGCFISDEKIELFKFAEILPNKPDLFRRMNESDDEDYSYENSDYDYDYENDNSSDSDYDYDSDDDSHEINF